jgi:serine/threonine protein kinase/Tol biopolymer transport system component
MPLSAGVMLGPYEIRSLLGAGGMGEVYLARDTRLDRDVALKLLPPALTQDPDRLRRFEQEARSASALNHPAIVAVYDLGQSDGQPYISMEFVDGQTLRDILAPGPLPARRALHIAAQIADGLAKAHDAGIVHRDLKPENVMLSNDGFAKILDFGLAKLVAGDVESRSIAETMTAKGTRPGTVMGTVGYMSPEQASGRPADNRSDQFSFGVVLYEMLTGQRAFNRSTAVETMSAIIRDDATPIGQLAPSIPVPVRWIVERCLAKAPADRYGSTRDLARDLASARDHLSELTSSGAVSVTAPVPRSTSRTREAVAWSLAAVFALAAIVLLFRDRAAPSVVPVRPVRFPLAPPEKVIFQLGIGGPPFAVSPDGRTLVFTGVSENGLRQLWLRPFDSLTSRPLAGTEGGAGPFWSPDGLSVGFFAQNRMKRLSLSSGDVTIICEARTGGGATWNRDGVIVFAPAADSALFRVAASGGTPAAVTTLDSAHDESAHMGPLFLPDGRHFLFRKLGRDNAGTYVGTLDSTEHKHLSTEQSMLGFASPDYFFFVRDRALMADRIDLTRLQLKGDPIRVAEGIDTLGPAAAFAVSPAGTIVYWSGRQTITQPTWMLRDGTVTGTVGPPAAYVNVAIAPDGRQVAVDRFDPEPAIWLLDVARGTSTRATFGRVYESTPVWAPDGQAFVYALARDAPPNLFFKRMGSTGADERLFRNTFQSFPQSWSPDSRFIAYTTVNPNTSSDIWLFPTTGDRKPVPFLQSPFAEDHPRISPDGRWMAYVSNESGRSSVYVTRFPEPGGKWQVSVEAGGFPVWRRDGRELFYRARDGKLLSVSVGTGADFEAGPAKPLFAPRVFLAGPGGGTFYDVAPDGRFLVNVIVEQTSSPATVVMHWTAGAPAPQP